MHEMPKWFSRALLAGLGVILLLTGCAPAIRQEITRTVSANSTTAQENTPQVHTRTTVPTDPSLPATAEYDPRQSSETPAKVEITTLEHGHLVRVSVDPSLALSVETASIPAVPVDPGILFAESLPAAGQFRFLGYHEDQHFRLPYPLSEPRLSFYATDDFHGYGDDPQISFPSNLENLRALLAEKPELSMCDSLPDGDRLRLPFLPWLNSAQVFCARPQYLQFNGGEGIRYLTAFSQEAGSPLDDSIFYTFQGLSEDGEIYLSAVFPVRTGVFPSQPDPNLDMQTWLDVLQSQFEQLVSADENSFDPPPAELDELIRDIQVSKP